MHGEFINRLSFSAAVEAALGAEAAVERSRPRSSGVWLAVVF